MDRLLLCLFAVLLCAVSGILNTDVQKWLGGGKCRMKWRSERLTGECTGLQPHTAFEELKPFQVVNNSMACKSICCNLEDRCTTWQYEINSKTCLLGGPTLVHNETAPAGMNIVGKCKEPVSRWSGRVVADRKNKTCSWGAKLPNRCTGMGPERKVNGTKLGARHCEIACCESKECDMWQESPAHGCYFNVKEKVTCDEAVKGKLFDGGRKCIPGLCGGKENTILNRTVVPASVLRAKANANSSSVLLNDNAPTSTGVLGTAINAFKSAFGNVGATHEISRLKNVVKPGPAVSAGGAAVPPVGADGRPSAAAGPAGLRTFSGKPRPMKTRPKMGPGRGPEGAAAAAAGADGAGGRGKSNEE